MNYVVPAAIDRPHSVIVVLNSFLLVFKIKKWTGNVLVNVYHYLVLSFPFAEKVFQEQQ